MADYKLLGKNYQTPDLYAKVTGRSKYAEDHRAEGMVFCKLLVSPMPHARIRSIDTSAAEALPGVEGILTADEIPEVTAPGEAALTNEPLYEGEPILAVAAVDEQTAADAIELIELDLEPLPFVLDPLDSLHPGGPNARLDGNTMHNRELDTIKWTEADVAGLAPGEIPMAAEAGEPSGEYGDLAAGFAEADVVVEEHSYHQSLSHQPLESRTTMAYWEGGKLFVYPSVQSTARSIGPMARYAGIEPSDVVLINEFTGGGFGSKGSGYPQAQIPILLSKKIGKPVMMRVTRRDETSFGKARPGMQARIKLGMRRDGRITALDIHCIGDGGPYGRRGDTMNVGGIGSVAYQPVAMRMRGTGVYTNTPPRGAQRAPGGEQSMTMLSPIIQKAAKQLGLDQVEVLKINAPEGQARYGAPGADGQQGNVSSAFAREAIDKGAELFNWRERVQRSGRRTGSKLTGIGVALSTYSAGASGVDGLFVIKPDGRMYIKSGIGNLGTESTFRHDAGGGRRHGHAVGRSARSPGVTPVGICPGAVRRAAAPRPTPTRGRTGPRSSTLVRSCRRSRHVTWAGRRATTRFGGERVYRRGNRSQGLSFARVAERAIALGGKYDGHELPEDINGMTTASATALTGQGLMGVAKDNFAEGGRRMSFVAGFAEVEVDTETGEIRGGRLRRWMRCRHHHPPQELRGTGVRWCDPGILRGPESEVGLRPALGAAGGEAVLQQPATGHPRRATRAADEVGGRGSAGPVQPARCEGYR